MPRWTIDSPTTIDLPGVAALKVRVVSGSVAILGSEDAPSLDVASLTGQPLLVTHEAGILTITYEDLQWDGLKGWLHPQRHSADVTVTVPAGCPTQVGVVNASAIVSGISASISAKSASGDITLDGVTGNVDAKTVSGDLEARGIDGEVAFNSISGGLTLAGGVVSRLAATTVSGQVTADIDLRDVTGDRGHLEPGAVAQVDVGRDLAVDRLGRQPADHAARQRQAAGDRVERDLAVDAAGLQVAGHGVRVHVAGHAI